MTRYTFTEKDLEIIKDARKKNKDKRAEFRLHALQLRAEGKKSKDIAKEMGINAPYISQLSAKYFKCGIAAPLFSLIPILYIIFLCLGTERKDFCIYG